MIVGLFPLAKNTFINISTLCICIGVNLEQKFNPLNKEKYKGNVESIYARSSWELEFMFMLDSNTNVIEWSSEELVIPYRSASGRKNRYFIDFVVKMKLGDKVKDLLIEIKPINFCNPNNQTNSLYIIKQIEKNILKWTAVKEYAKINNYDFYIVSKIVDKKTSQFMFFSLNDIGLSNI